MIKPKEGEVLQVFKNFSWTIVDFLRFSPEFKDEIRSTCSVEGLSGLDSVLKEGRGAIMVSPHLGPWETAGAYLASLGYKINAVALEHPSPRVTRFFSRMRGRWGIEDYSIEESGEKSIKALHRGEIVVLLIDRNYSGGGIDVEFLGHRAWMPYGHIVLAKRTGSYIVPSYCYYDNQKNIRIIISDPLDPEESDDDERGMMRECLSRIEDPILNHYHQWFIFDHVWYKE